MPIDVKTHVALGLDRPTPMEVNGRSNADIAPSLTHAGDAPYHPCPEAFPAASVATGTVTKHVEWNQSRIYPNTHRDLFVYTPAGLDASRPAALIVFNDGSFLASPTAATVASRLGLKTRAEQPLYDLVVVGAGPAGLAAAVPARAIAFAIKSVKAGVILVAPLTLQTPST